MSAIKDKVDNVIRTYGSDITIRTNVSTTNDKWGKPIVASYTDRTIKAVKDNYLKSRAFLASLGRVENSSSNLTVLADEVFDTKKDKVIISGTTYNILEVQDLEISNEVLAKLLRVEKA